MSTDDQNADLEAIRTRYAASTPGTWRWTSDAYSERLETDAGAPVAIASAIGNEDATIVASDADVAFIANAHQDIPWLLGEMVRLRAETAALSAVIDLVRVYLKSSHDGEVDDIELLELEAFDAMCASMRAYYGTEPAP